jgi:hypothetical protein
MRRLIYTIVLCIFTVWALAFIAANQAMAASAAENQP